MLTLFKKISRYHIALWVENGGLKMGYSGPAPDADIIQEIKANKEDIILFLIKKAIHSGTDFTTMQATSVQPLSFAQERLWFLAQFEQGGHAYHMPYLVRLNEQVDEAVLLQAINQVAERHPVLNSCYGTSEEGEGYTQQLDREIGYFYHQIRDFSALEQAVVDDITQPFNLHTQAPLRLSLYRVYNDREEQRYLLLLLHHIAFDGWSLDIFFHELEDIYAALIRGQVTQLAEPVFRYSDYAVWQRRYLQGERLDKQLRYWLAELEALEPLHLPYDHARPKQMDFRGAQFDFTCNEDLSTQLRLIAKQQHTTLYVVMLTAFYITLHKLSEQQDIVLGMPSGNRHHARTQSLIGCFVNALPLRVKIDPNSSCLGLLLQVHRTVSGAKSHQDLPFEKLVSELDTIRDRARHPIFQVMFSLQRFGQRAKVDTALFEQVSLSHHHEQAKPIKFDLSLFIDDSDLSLKGQWSYALGLFDEETIHRFAHMYQKALVMMAGSLQQMIGKMDLLSGAERYLLLHDWNQKKATHLQDKTLTQSFDEQVKKTPDHIAWVFEGNQLTYRELSEKMDKLVYVIRAQYQFTYQEAIPAETLVALYFDRGIDMVLAMLATLKAGGAYVPISPDYPTERSIFILQDTQAPLLLTQCHYRDEISAWIKQADTCLPLLIMVDDPSISDTQASGEDEALALTDGLDWGACAMDRLAYVIYTSGTTGTPKGVMITQLALMDYLEHFKPFISKENAVMGACLNYCFDAAVPTFFAGCVQCVTTHLISDQQRNNDLLFYIQSHAVNIMRLTPSMLHFLAADLQSLSEPLTLVLGGETIDENVINRFDPRYFRIINQYGPTECTVGSCYFPIVREDETGIEVASTADKQIIGKAYTNTSLYVLNAQLLPVPIGTPGELYIGGAGLARGYLNSKALTHERFIPHPFMDKQDTLHGYTRLYKSGDRVRYLPDGNLEYLGRNDDQVKIRGYRIELGEIEHALSQIEGIKQAVVIEKQQQNRQYLAAYWVSDDKNGCLQPLTRDNLRTDLSACLPEYMLPATFTQMDAIPLTLNGKLNRKVLPEPEIVDDKHYVAPCNAVEEALTVIWQTVLGIEHIGIHDNFFHIGGDSIISIQLVSRLRQQGYTLQVSHIFDCPSIAQLAYYLINQNNSLKVNAEQGILNGDVTLLPIQQWFFEQNFDEPDHYNQAFMMRLPHHISIDAVNVALKALSQQHDMLRVTFSRRLSEENTDQYVQSYTEKSSMRPLEVIDVENLSEADLQQALTQLQASLSLAEHRLWQVVYLRGDADHSLKLCFILHHLIIDAVSWRIIADDLQRLLTGQTLMAKSSSYRQWEAVLSLYAEQHNEQHGYWQQQLRGMTALNEPLKTVSVNVQSLATLTWSAALTERLLRDAPRGFYTEINDLLLTALTLAVSEALNVTELGLTLEGHGREDLDATIDVTRTVGWFTCLYPVRLSLQSSLNETLIQVKESLRAIPDKGIGFGALGFNRETLPLIGFNYLGQFDHRLVPELSDPEHSTETETETETKLWQLTHDMTGEPVSKHNQRHFLLDFNGGIINGKLHFNLGSRLNNQITQALVTCFKHAVERVVDSAVDQAQQGGQHTPCDYLAPDLSLSRLRTLESRFDIDTIFAANSLQQGFIYHALTAAEDDAYRVQLLIDYQEELDIDCYKQAWRLASLKYPSLRIAFDWDGEPLQIITRACSLTEEHFTQIDLSHLSLDERDASITSLQVADRKKAFDLSKPGLMRFTIIRHAINRYTVMKTDHHSIKDGWSTPVLWQYVQQTYRALMRGEQPEREVDTAYLETQKWYVTHQQAAKSYWAEQQQTWQGMNNINALLTHPLESMPAKQVNIHKSHALNLPKEELIALKALCKKQAITLNVAVQFAWHKLLHTYTGDSQTIVGTTVSGRNIPITGIESSVGLYINTLPLAVNWTTSASVASVLNAIQKSVLELNQYSNIALASLQDKGEALFQSLLIFENYPVNLDENNTQDLSIRAGIEKTDYPLTLTVAEESQGIRFNLDYVEDYLSKQQVSRLLVQLKRILVQLSEHLDKPHETMSLLSHGESQQLLYDWNQTDVTYPRHQSVQQLFEAQVKQSPHAVALVFEGVQLTYAQLNETSNQLAHFLQEQHHVYYQSGFTSNTPIMLYLDRSIDMIVAILAVLKVGAAYVPVSPEYPQARTEFIVDDTQADFVLTQGQYLAHLNKGEFNREVKPHFIAIDTLAEQIRLQPRDDLAVVVSGQELAYIIYTSGTTGQPKGVMIEHRNVMNTLFSMNKIYAIDRQYRKVGCFSHYVFDVSVSEMFNTLCFGGQLFLLNDETRKDPNQLAQFINDNQLHYLFLPPALLAVLPRAAYPSLQAIIVAGDTCDQVTGQYWSAHYPLYNFYGPTETSIYASGRKIDPTENVNIIGRPLDNVRLYVLNTHLVPVPIGAVGELYIGGAGVARGYLKRDELTSDCFINHPFTTETDKALGFTRLYKTGDWVRFLPDGDLEYLGRRDQQVKLRGHRIELNEIETRLSALEGVAQAVVITTQTQQELLLAAYWIASEPTENTPDWVSVQGLRSRLAMSLPDYMLPSSFTQIDSLPLTLNGKIDIKALPKPNTPERSDCVAPRNDIEQQLVAIWQALLGLKQVSIEDNFFHIGGDSILSIQLVSKLRQVGFSLQVKTIFDFPLLMQLADKLTQECEVTIKAEQGELTGAFALLPIQADFFAHQFVDEDHFNQSFMLTIPEFVTLDKLEEALRQLSIQHDMLRARFVRTEMGTQQVYQSSTSMKAVQMIDTIGLSEQACESALTALQASLSIQDHALWQVVYLTGYQDGLSRLCFMFHHLIIDAVSWRILAQDLRTLLQGESLGNKTSSYRQWQQALVEYSRKNPTEQQDWLNVMTAIEHIVYPKKQKLEYIDIHWGPQLTEQLLSQSPKGYNTDINDLLLAALSYALSQTLGMNEVALRIEGHGREPIDPSLDVSQTLGWFTSIYPVLLNVCDDISAHIIATKELLRAIPNKGIGYGASSLIDEQLTYGMLPPISFNYLGQFGHHNEDHQRVWQITHEETGLRSSSFNDLGLLLNINGAVIDGKLAFNIASRLTPSQNKTLRTTFKERLAHIVEHTIKVAEQGGIQTPYDQRILSQQPYVEYHRSAQNDKVLIVLPLHHMGYEAYLGTLVPHLSPDFDLILLDSDRDKKHSNFDDYADALVDIIMEQQLLQGKRCALLGWSFGAVLTHILAVKLIEKGVALDHCFLLEPIVMHYVTSQVEYQYEADNTWYYQLALQKHNVHSVVFQCCYSEKDSTGIENPMTQVVCQSDLLGLKTVLAEFEHIHLPCSHNQMLANPEALKMIVQSVNLTLTDH